VEESYTSSAQTYDVIYAEVVDYPATAARLTELIRSHKSDATTLLEAACGTGAVVDALRGDFEVSGFDLSAEMLAIARHKLPGVELRQADMVNFDWGGQFDAVICMFSSIGYLTTLQAVEQAYRRFAAHVVPDGVVVVEPWFTPDVWIDGHVGTNLVAGDGVTVMRMNSSWLEDEGRVSAMDMHHLVGRPGSVEHFVERHRLSLVTVDEHLAAFAAAGLAMEHDPDGFMGRGLYVGGLA